MDEHQLVCYPRTGTRSFSNSVCPKVAFQKINCSF